MNVGIFFAILLISTTAYATSIRTSDENYLAVKRVSADTVIIHGRPGKQGVMGPIGPAGPKGEKGDVGICTCDLSEVTELKQRIKALEELSSLDEGWFTPGNGYQYIATVSTQSWHDSRKLCQSMGGDLASAGMRNYHTRFIIARAIQYGEATWIGMNDITNEGSYLWIDGVTGTAENIHWHPGEPNNNGGEGDRKEEDCLEIWGSHKLYLSNDRSCAQPWQALCEKRLG